MSDPTDKPDLFKQDGKCDNFRRKGNSLLQIACSNCILKEAGLQPWQRREWRM